ncbi:MAG: polyprenyl synthetase family protein [Proteobacteria bacterium]|nr:polyprenyl synthetase family protein [Pseudomonadota bacterium]
MNDLSFDQYYSKKLELIESFLIEDFPKIPEPVSALDDSMRYSLFAGGKRIRPILLLTTVECAGMDSEFALPFAGALEYIHTYSLIHDDLPCMDDDDLRRGQATNHIRFGEDIALLAGDALLTHSFCLISSPRLLDRVSAPTLLRIVNILAEKAGVFGMVAGQVADIGNRAFSSPENTLDFIHSHKTGALITAAIQIGAMLSQVEPQAFEAMSKFGEEIGKCFQIQDDILDETGNEELLGKKPGSDRKNKTLTFPSVYGLEKSGELANRCYENALNYLEQSGLKAARLKELANFVLKRNR